MVHFSMRRAIPNYEVVLLKVQSITKIIVQAGNCPDQKVNLTGSSEQNE